MPYNQQKHLRIAVEPLFLLTEKAKLFNEYGHESLSRFVLYATYSIAPASLCVWYKKIDKEKN